MKTKLTKEQAQARHDWYKKKFMDSNVSSLTSTRLDLNMAKYYREEMNRYAELLSKMEPTRGLDTIAETV